MPLVTSAVNRTLVQYATTWPTSNVGWITLEGAWATSMSEGFCNDLGSATVVYPFGTIKRQGVDGDAITYTELDLCGAYIRIAEEDPSGSIIADDGTKFTGYWVGIGGEMTMAPNSAATGYDMTMACQGILSVLDQIVPPLHFGVPVGGSASPAADIGCKLSFNMLGNRKTGNRSADKYDFGDGYSAYVFDMSGDGEDWTAGDIVEYAIAIARYSAPGGTAFTIGGQASSFTFKEKFNLNGMSCLEMITRTLNPRQGVGFRTAYDGSGTVLIDVMSLSQTIMDIGDGNTLPANDRQRTLNLTPNGVNSEWTTRQSHSAMYDDVSVIFGAPQYAVTFSLLDFEPDWTTEEATALDALDDDDAARSDGPLARVYRRFRMKANWSGVPTSDFEMPTSREYVTSDVHGEEGYTGEQLTDGELVETKAIRLLRNLPMPEGYDWANPPSEFDKSRKDMKPVAIVGSNGFYQTLAEYCGLEDIRIDVDEDVCAFTIGPASVVESIADLIALGDKLYITLGVESQMESVVSWRRPAGQLTRDKRRVISKNKEKLRRRFIAKGTYLGVKDDMLEKSPNTLTTVEDDLPLAKNVLAVLQPWYANPEWAISRTLKGTIVLPEDYVTGDMITMTSFQFIDGTTVEIPMVAIITSIVRDYTGDGRVTVSTKRIDIATEAIA
jgi:hypothetical protein